MFSVGCTSQNPSAGSRKGTAIIRRRLWQWGNIAYLFRRRAARVRVSAARRSAYVARMAERFERHRQPWRPDEIQKLYLLAKKGMALKAIAKALTRSEESVKVRAKADCLAIAKLH